jgi:hypothetical protein
VITLEHPDRRKEPADPFEREGETANPPTDRDVAEAITEELLNIHVDSYGRGAERAVSHIVDDTLIVVLDGLELLPNEEFLVQNGQEDAVAHLRTQYQKAIEPIFRAAVERDREASGRVRESHHARGTALRGRGLPARTAVITRAMCEHIARFGASCGLLHPAGGITT